MISETEPTGNEVLISAIPRNGARFGERVDYFVSRYNDGWRIQRDSFVGVGVISIGVVPDWREVREFFANQTRGATEI